MEDLTGKQLGPYQIVAPLGEGGMAAVYKAYQPAMERYVAVKILPRTFASDPTFVARFQREAKLLAQLQHPHILPVFDFGQADGYTYLVMPFVESGTLAALLTGELLPLVRVRQIISQVGGALHYAHTRGLIHRDVKPSNVLLDESGNSLLTDFGLARMVEASVNLTTSGTIVGTPAYMSPEQGSGQDLDARSDIYSLGVILYEMASGRVPYKAETPVAVIFKHIQDPLPPPRTLNPALPEEVELVILKALAKQPEGRFATAADMVRALQAAIPEAASTFPGAPPAKLRSAQAGRPTRAATRPQPAPASPTDRATLKPTVSVRPPALPLPRWAYVLGAVVIGVVLIGVVGLFIFLGGGVQTRLFGNRPPALTTSPAAAPPTETIGPSTTLVQATATRTPTPSPTPTPTSNPPPIATLAPTDSPMTGPTGAPVTVKLRLVTGNDGTGDNPTFTLLGNFSASPYQIVLSQPGDLQPGATDFYVFTAPASFCQITNFELRKPGDDELELREIGLTIDGISVYFDAVVDESGFYANSSYGGGWVGTAEYKVRCTG